MFREDCTICITDKGFFLIPVDVSANLYDRTGMYIVL